jgi:hypothetical protein
LTQATSSGGGDACGAKDFVKVGFVDALGQIYNDVQATGDGLGSIFGGDDHASRTHGLALVSWPRKMVGEWVRPPTASRAQAAMVGLAQRTGAPLRTQTTPVCSMQGSLAQTTARSMELTTV